MVNSSRSSNNIASTSQSLLANKVMFVGDVHLKAQNPSCRKDNYAEAILKKLNWILSYCQDNEIYDVVFLGDFFDTPTVAWSLFTTVVQLLQDMKASRIRCYSLVGNHDIRYDRLDTLSETSLGVLFLSKLLIRLSENPIKLSDGYEIIGFDFTQPIVLKDSSTETRKSICVAHEYFQCEFSDTTLRKEDLARAGFSVYIFGHDHAPYAPFQGEGWVLYRTGSLARNSSDMHNRMRIPRVLVYDASAGTFDFVNVDASKDPNEVIMSHREETSVSMFDLVDALCNSSLDKCTSVREYVYTMQMPLDVRLIITRYLDTLGV